MKEHEYSSASMNVLDFIRENCATENLQSGNKQKKNQPKIPQITLPKGDAALTSFDEKFSVNAVNGKSIFPISLPTSPRRNHFQPLLELSYNSGTSNSLFGSGSGVDYTTIQR